MKNTNCPLEAISRFMRQIDPSNYKEYFKLEVDMDWKREEIKGVTLHCLRREPGDLDRLERSIRGYKLGAGISTSSVKTGARIHIHRT